MSARQGANSREMVAFSAHVKYIYWKLPFREVLMPEQPTPITVAHGDGIGPEIMEATLRIIQAAGAQLEIETIEIGEAVYKRGSPAGIEPSAWDSLRRTKVFLKAPITTPQGGGFKSLNVTVRKTFGLFANVRPVHVATSRSCAPSTPAWTSSSCARTRRTSTPASSTARPTRSSSA